MGSKTIVTCDVIVDKNVGRDALAANPEASLCQEAALQDQRFSTISICSGNNLFNVCHKHAKLPFIDLLRALGLIE
jgi:hypothetical protein